MNKDTKEQTTTTDFERKPEHERPTVDSAPCQEPGKKTDQPEQNSPIAEHLPLGTGYQVKKLPVEVVVPSVIFTDKIIPDLVKEAQISEKLDEPIAAPEDDFYDFEKDIYGDEAEFRP